MPASPNLRDFCGKTGRELFANPLRQSDERSVTDHANRGSSMRQLAPITLFAALLITARPALADDPLAHRTISTTGESIVYVTPDEVVVSFGVETFNADLDKSKADNDARSSKLLAAVKSLGVEDKHVQTDTLNIEVRYKDYNRNATEIEGYFARRQYSVTLKDTKLFEKLIDTILKNGGNRLMGFEFRTTELRKHRDEARKLAIKAAKEKAVDLARELNMNVGKPRTIGEGYSGFYGGRGYYGGWGMNSFNVAQNSVQVAPGGGGGEGEGTLPLGQLAVRASISVTFDID
jgi:uncharacterized protein YggE